MKKRISTLLKSVILALCIPLASGCNNGKEEPKYWTLMAESGEGYSIVSNTDEVTLLNGTASVKDGTEFNFSLRYEDGYLSDPAPTVKANNTVLTRNSDLSYDTVISSDVVISVSDVSKKKEYYEIEFQSGTGYVYSETSVTLDPSNKASVEEGTVVSFKVSILDGYEAEYLVVRANGELVSSKGGKYSFTPTGNTIITVSGVEQETAKHTIAFVKGTGYSFTNVSVDLEQNGTALVNEGTEVTFLVLIDESYSSTSYTVKANGVTLTLSETDGLYHVTVSEDMSITVTNLVDKTYHVIMRNGDNYSLTNVTGITLTEGEGDVKLNTTITFTLVLSSGTDKGETFSVSFAGKDVTKVDGDTYSFVPESDGELVVSGLTCSEAVVYDEVVIASGTASDDINTDAGYTKSTEYAGNWGVKLNINETELAQYADLRFSVKCVTNHYFEFKCDTVSGLADIATNSTGWTEYKFVREELLNGDNEVTGYKYQIYKNGEWVPFHLSSDGYLNDYQIMLGGSTDTAKFLISELRGRKDPNYVPGQKEIKFNEETSNHTLTVEGQSAPYKGNMDEDFTFTVVPTSGYTSVVRFNGQYILPTSENTYTIKVTKSNVITIVDTKVVSDSPIQNATDNENGTSSISASWNPNISLQLSDVTNLTSYKTLFFEFCLQENGYFIFKKNGVSATGTVGLDAGVWHTATISINDDASSVNITISAIYNDSEYPEDGFDITLDNNALSDVAIAFHSSTESSTNTGIFSALFGTIER